MGVGAGLYMCDVVKKKFTFAISSPDEFLSSLLFVLLPIPVSFWARVNVVHRIVSCRGKCLPLSTHRVISQLYRIPQNRAALTDKIERQAITCAAKKDISGLQ